MKSHAKAHHLQLVLMMAAVCLAAGTVRAQQAPEAVPEEQRIITVRVVTESGELLETNPPDIPARPDSPYQSEAVRESLRQLFRTGRYADVRAEATDVPGGVRLDFVVRRNFYIDLVHVVGLEPPPSEGVALAALRLGLGQAYRETLLTEALARLQATLAEEGYYQARIDYELSPVPRT